jgi:hypothetical protein
MCTTSSNGDMQFQTSSDLGATWSGETTIITDSGDITNIFHDVNSESNGNNMAFAFGYELLGGSEYENYVFYAQEPSSVSDFVLQELTQFADVDLDFNNPLQTPKATLSGDVLFYTYGLYNWISTTLTNSGLGSPNTDPVCTDASPSINSLWPPNHVMNDITISDVTDPDGDTVTITIDGITQDEPTPGPDEKHSPDGDGVGTDTAEIRAERDGSGDGRVYEVSFTADDGNGGTCTGSVTVGVPHDKKDTAVDSGQSFDSTVP